MLSFDDLLAELRAHPDADRIVQMWKGRVTRGRKVGDTCPADAVPLLGTMKDVDLARRLGVGPASVRAWRRRRGVPSFRMVPQARCSTSPPRPPPSWFEPIRARLGLESDSDLARAAGVSRERIRQLRAGLGIPALAPSGTNERLRRPLPDEARAWFGVVADAEIARRLRVTTSMIGTWRLRYSLPRPPIARVSHSCLDAHRDKFGVLTDVSLAREAGCSYANVVAYRRIHPDLPRSPRSRKM